MADYRQLERLGSGGFGTVFRVIDLRSGELLAMKTFPNLDLSRGPPCWLKSEICFVKALRHANIVEYRDLIMHIDASRIVSGISIVMELLDTDMYNYMRAHGEFTGNRLQNAFGQCVAAVDYCHQYLIIHSDVKPQNFLVHNATMRIKLADFGCAVPCNAYSRDRSPCVVLPPGQPVYTVPYRGPELLLTVADYIPTCYTPKADVWALGCVFAEMMTGVTFFTGWASSRRIFTENGTLRRASSKRIFTEIGTLFDIFNKRGTPTVASWPGVNTLPHWSGSFPQWRDDDFQHLRQSASHNCGSTTIRRSAAFRLLASTLTCDPAQRISARDLKMHEFFINQPPEVRAVAFSLLGQCSLSSAFSLPWYGEGFVDAFALDIANFLGLSSR